MPLEVCRVDGLRCGKNGARTPLELEEELLAVPEAERGRVRHQLALEWRILELERELQQWNQRCWGLAGFLMAVLLLVLMASQGMLARFGGA